MGCIHSRSIDQQNSLYANEVYQHVDYSQRGESLLPGPSISTLNTYHQGLVGAARWPDDAPGLNVSNKSHTPENREYCTKMYESIRHTGALIANGSIESFDQRGSAAKPEYAVRSIVYAHGFEMPPFAHGKVSDIEAMLMSCEQFVSNYRSMLEYEFQ